LITTGVLVSLELPQPARTAVVATVKTIDERRALTRAAAVMTNSFIV
jgi:hypothetical protein